jgi:hypothetical protein
MDRDNKLDRGSIKSTFIYKESIMDSNNKKEDKKKKRNKFQYVCGYAYYRPCFSKYYEKRLSLLPDYILMIISSTKN